MLNAPILLERDHQSLTIAWEGHESAQHYEVEMLTIANEQHESHAEHGDKPAHDWMVLSSTIKSTLVKKKNLLPSVGYAFRVRFQDSAGIWCSMSAASETFYVLHADTKLMAAPTMLTHDGNSITLQWEEVPHAQGYHLRYRINDDVHWQTIENTITTTMVRKKGLDAANAHYFAIKPLMHSSHEGNWAYSLSSVAYKPAVLSTFLKDLFPTTLLSKQGKVVNSTDVLAGKVIAVYFSAHWCGPCRNFTPKLVDLYNQVKAQNKNLEVIFCSADHNEADFQGYYASMPWLAVDFEDPIREGLMGKFKVSGIPRLCVLSPSGRIIDDNAAGKHLNLHLVDDWVKQG